VLVAEHERVRLQVEALGHLATLPGDRVRTEQADILDELGPAQPLEHRVDLAHLDGPAERPARALGAAVIGWKYP